VLQARKYGRVGAIDALRPGTARGEVVGLAGLLGSGRTETGQHLLFGADKPDSGSLTVGEKAVTHHSPLNAIRQAMAFAPKTARPTASWAT
jgi:monosaccharide-transporting ATPase